jgi:hypothetical protein
MKKRFFVPLGVLVLLREEERVEKTERFNYLRDLIANAASFVPGGKTRGPVALLTAEPALYEVAVRFVELERAKSKLQVFREIGPAKVWLTRETTAPT